MLSSGIPPGHELLDFSSRPVCIQRAKQRVGYSLYNTGKDCITNLSHATHLTNKQKNLLMVGKLAIGLAVPPKLNKHRKSLFNAKYNQGFVVENFHLLQAALTFGTNNLVAT